MRLIDADELLKRKEDHQMISTHIIWNAPTVDAVPVIRCRECEYSIDFYEDGECYCKRPGRALEYKGQKWDGYCDAGKRREE